MYIGLSQPFHFLELLDYSNKSFLDNTESNILKILMTYITRENKQVNIIRPLQCVAALYPLILTAAFSSGFFFKVVTFCSLYLYN